MIDTSSGVPEVIVLDPAGHKTTVPVKVRQIEPNRWRCEYVSNLVGLHSVNIFFAGIPIKNSPFGVKIAPCKCMDLLQICEIILIKRFFKCVIQEKCV